MVKFGVRLDSLVTDESHLVKNSGADRSQNLSIIGSVSARNLALSGKGVCVCF